MKKRKVAIVGTGAVGSTIAYTTMMSGIAGEIVLVDHNREVAAGHALDLNHGLPFVPAVTVQAADYSGCAGADIIVIAAGIAKVGSGDRCEAGEQSRLELVGANVRILREMLPRILEVNREAIFLVVSNPVDVLTHAALRITGLPANQVIGSGTVLDSSRFRYLLSQHCQVDIGDVHGHVIGEHGDSAVLMWSQAAVGGVPIDAFCRNADPPIRFDESDRDMITHLTKTSAAFVAVLKGATYYAVSLSVLHILRTIFRDERHILTVSSRTNGAYGTEDICLSLPVVVTSEGATARVGTPLAEDELEQLRASSRILAEVQQKLEI